MFAALQKNKKLIGGTAVTLAAAYFLFKKKAPEKTTANILTNDTGEEQSTQSYIDSNYYLLADKLKAAMFDAGTDEANIYGVFNALKTAKDLLLLIKAFGIRPYYTFGLKQGDYNLAQWFTEELSDEEIQKINSILAKKNINFSF